MLFLSQDLPSIMLLLSEYVQIINSCGLSLVSILTITTRAPSGCCCHSFVLFFVPYSLFFKLPAATCTCFTPTLLGPNRNNLANEIQCLHIPVRARRVSPPQPAMPHPPISLWQVIDLTERKIEESQLARHHREHLLFPHHRDLTAKPPPLHSSTSECLGSPPPRISMYTSGKSL